LTKAVFISPDQQWAPDGRTVIAEQPGELGRGFLCDQQGLFATGLPYFKAAGQIHLDERDGTSGFS